MADEEIDHLRPDLIPGNVTVARISAIQSKVFWTRRNWNTVMEIYATKYDLMRRAMAANQWVTAITHALDMERWSKALSPI